MYGRDVGLEGATVDVGDLTMYVSSPTDGELDADSDGSDDPDEPEQGPMGEHGASRSDTDTDTDSAGESATTPERRQATLDEWRGRGDSPPPLAADDGDEPEDTDMQATVEPEAGDVDVLLELSREIAENAGTIDGLQEQFDELREQLNLLKLAVASDVHDRLGARSPSDAEDDEAEADASTDGDTRGFH